MSEDEKKLREWIGQHTDSPNGHVLLELALSSARAEVREVLAWLYNTLSAGEDTTLVVEAARRLGVDLDAAPCRGQDGDACTAPRPSDVMETSVDATGEKKP